MVRLASTGVILMMVSLRTWTVRVAASVCALALSVSAAEWTGWTYYRLDQDVPEDPDVAARVTPYRAELKEIMERPLTTSTAVMPMEKPESALGNLMADILRHEANTAFEEEVHIALMNGRGLRITLPEGTIRVRTIYELMPFENHIAVLQFTGTQLAALADEIARYGGEPISGMHFVFHNGQARDIEVNGQPLDLERHYWLATNNWMANGGGELPTLWSPRNRVDLPVLIRDAFIEHLDGLTRLEPRLDGRIREEPLP